MASEQMIIAIIGVFSALGVILLKDVIVRPIHERQANKRTLIQMRLEKAYVPLEYLSFRLIGAYDKPQQERLIHEIGTILQRYGHLLSESSLSALYTLCEDVNAGALMMRTSFTPECTALKRSFYQMWNSWHDPDDHDNVQQV